MKEIDFISSENVVNIESPEKINIIGEHFYGDNNAVLLKATDKKIVIIQKNWDCKSFWCFLQKF